jgi:hypothetical protein
MIDVCTYEEDVFALTQEGNVYRLAFLKPAGAVHELLQQNLAPLAAEVNAFFSSSTERLCHRSIPIFSPSS